ncbi:hypothetical protein RHDC4_00052 [Rhodocyclaceae bacterium]|nr:hypothetical protein RHDC4_00052 [Rhodocyclaceae bacterium]
MKRHTVYRGTAALLGTLACIGAFAQEGAQVLFSNGSLTVIDAGGNQRVAKQGDMLLPGDRLVTPPGVLAQIKLPDGAMVSARPESELRLERMGANADRTVLQLNQGNVRVLNVDAPPGIVTRPVEVVTSTSTLQLTRGDGESILVKPGGRAEPGTYNRVQVGEAVMRTAAGSLPLQTQQAAFAPRPETSPTIIAELPKALALAPATGATPPGRGGPVPAATSQLVTPAGGVARTDAYLARVDNAAPGTAGFANPSARIAGAAPIGGTGPLSVASTAINRVVANTATAVTQTIANTSVRLPKCTVVKNRLGQDVRVCN